MPKADVVRSPTEAQDHTRPAAETYVNAPYLAAMAHFGQAVIATVALARDHIVAITTMSKVAKKRHEEVPDALVWNLERVARALQDLEGQFKADFFRELRVHAASAGPDSSPNRTDLIKPPGGGQK